MNTKMIRFWFVYISSWCLFTSVEPSLADSVVVVDSPFGKILGASKTDENTGLSYLSFKGIPYAKPPVGDLRFAKPQPHPKLDSDFVFDASKEDKILCPHPRFLASDETKSQEDCLILNIFTKDLRMSNSLEKVIVFIHGGSFIFGSSSHFDSKSFVISQDVIVVTINYRLGVLGFLSTENEASPGNYGLWDQNLAIHWVKDNIRAFGGDPDDITIAGSSAGASSVGYQSLSPYAKGLFTKAYQQSASASSVYARCIGAQSHALGIAKSAGCWDGEVDSTVKIDVKESKDVIDCIRKAPVSVFTDFIFFTTSKTQFVPVVDGDFVPDVPAKLLHDDDYLESVGFFDRSYLIGINNRDDGVIEQLGESDKRILYSDNQTSEEEKDAVYDTYLAKTKDLYMTSRLGEAGASDENITSTIDDFYLRRVQEDRVVVEIVSDLTFIVPSVDFLTAASRRQSCRSYLLYFDYFPNFMKGMYRGATHDLDLMYWFDVDVDDLEKTAHAGMQGAFSEEDVELKKSFSSLLGDFIKTGTPGLSLDKIIPSGWQKYDPATGYYLRFNSKPWMDSFLMKDKQDLWFGTVPTLMQAH